MAGRKRLKTLSDVRRYLAGLINRVEAGEVDAGVMSKLAYAVNILSGIIQNSDIEKRLEQLEKQIEDKR